MTIKKFLTKAGRTVQGRYSLWTREYALRYHSLPRQPLAWWKNRQRRYTICTQENLLAAKKSDTLFILGSGPSLNNVTPDMWREVAAHDSIGINFSILKEFVPTYYFFEDGKTPWLRNFFAERFRTRKMRYSESIFTLNAKHKARLIHPRYTPDLFPDQSKVYYLPWPKQSILISEDRPFRPEDFRDTLIYRSSMSVALELAAQLGYQRIGLLGMDLQTNHYFFENDPEMKPYVQGPGREDVKHVEVLYSQAPVPRKLRPFQDYLIAVHEFVFKPRGGSLFVASPDNMLAGALPVYPWQRSEVGVAS